MLKDILSLPSRGGNRRPRIVFFHLPRTGGTALVKDVLFPNFRQSRWCHVNCGKDLKPVDDSHDPLAWSEAKRGRIRLLAGHMPFGLERHFPGPSEYVTLLRDPISRTVSDYYHCRENSTNSAHAAACSLSLTEFVERGYGLTHNCYTSLLSNAVYGAEFQTGDEMLSAARANLARFALVGITEMFDISIVRICERYHLVRFPLTASNRNDATPEGNDISSEERAVISRYNHYDQLLYEEYRTKFCTRVEPVSLSAQAMIS